MVRYRRDFFLINCFNQINFFFIHIQFLIGSIMNVFESILPAGANSYKGNKTTDYCILDCIYDQTTFTYYVLDLMCWKGHPIYDCDTEFRFVQIFSLNISCNPCNLLLNIFEKFSRFYWLNTKFTEIERPTANTS